MSRQTALLFVGTAVPCRQVPFNCSVGLVLLLIPQTRKARRFSCVAFVVYKRPQLAHFLWRLTAVLREEERWK